MADAANVHQDAFKAAIRDLGFGVWHDVDVARVLVATQIDCWHVRVADKAQPRLLVFKGLECFDDADHVTKLFGHVQRAMHHRELWLLDNQFERVEKRIVTGLQLRRGPVDRSAREVVEVRRVEAAEDRGVMVAEAGKATQFAHDVDAHRRLGAVADDVSDLHPHINVFALEGVDHDRQRIRVGVYIAENTYLHF